jgi:pyrroloquinoline quinone biosynthesis protein B
MRAIVLGSAAGGGLPQWNCGCPNCGAARAGNLAPRTQASLAVSGDGQEWILLGASPDVRVQIERTPALWPKKGRRSPILAAAIPNGDVDAWLGLLSLREWAPLEILATEPVVEDLLANPVLRTLERGPVRWVRQIDAGGLTVQAVAAPGKPPLHARRAAHPLDNVGFVVRDDHSALAWFPSVAAHTLEVERALVECDAVFFDGTFYSDDELQRWLPEAPPARAMGHWPVAESATFLSQLPARHKWLVHVNNTNPLLADDSLLCGVRVAHDGLEWTS